jgi:hypothetical protein
MRAKSLGIVSAVVLMVSCGGASTSTGETYRIATASVRSDFMNMARADGVIQGETNGDGTACFWIGTTSKGQALSWPYGYSARANPLAVYDDSGNRVAVVGNRVAMAGGLMPDSVHSITGCSGFTQFWGVGEVISAK